MTWMMLQLKICLFNTAGHDKCVHYVSHLQMWRLLLPFESVYKENFASFQKTNYMTYITKF